MRRKPFWREQACGPWCRQVRVLQPRHTYNGGAEPLMSRRRPISNLPAFRSCRVPSGSGERHVRNGWVRSRIGPSCQPRRQKPLGEASGEVQQREAGVRRGQSTDDRREQPGGMEGPRYRSCWQWSRQVRGHDRDRSVNPSRRALARRQSSTTSGPAMGSGQVVSAAPMGCRSPQAR